MGDRANVVMVQNHRSGTNKWRTPLFFYTHLGGSKLPARLRSALTLASEVNERFPQSRWQDEEYLGRIIFQGICDSLDDGITGYGLSAYMRDNEYPLLVVDAKTQTVGLAREEDLPDVVLLQKLTKAGLLRSSPK